MSYLIGKFLFNFWREILIFIIICFCCYPLLGFLNKKVEKSSWHAKQLEKAEDLVALLQELKSQGDADKIDKELKNNRFLISNSSENMKFALQLCAQFNLIKNLEYFTSGNVLICTLNQENIDESCRTAIIYDNIDVLIHLLSTNNDSVPKPDARSLFQFSASSGYSKTVAFFKSNADVWKINQMDVDNTFMIALKNKHNNVFSVLLSGSILFPSSEIFKEAFTYAQQNNMEDMKEILKSIQEEVEDLFDHD
jgi:hypothetical protein